MSKHYKVKAGDCLSSIAFEHGFFWEVIWNHPDNADLKRKREDPNILQAGDIVCIPDKSSKEESCETGGQHRFKVKGVPAKLRIRFRADEEPLSNECYRLTIDGGALIAGRLDGEGYLEISISPNSREAKVYIGQGALEKEYIFALGQLDPIQSLSGIQARLNALGYSCTGEQELGEGTRSALRGFQAGRGLPITGDANQETLGALAKAYKC